MKTYRFLVLTIIATTLPAMAADVPSTVSRGMKMFRAEVLRAHNKFLASDLLEGRGPGTRGDSLATEYLATQFEALGLEPAGETSTYFQRVPLLGITMDPAKTSLSFTKDGAASIPLKQLDDFVGTNKS